MLCVCMCVSMVVSVAGLNLLVFMKKAAMCTYQKQNSFDEPKIMVFKH